MKTIALLSLVSSLLSQTTSFDNRHSPIKCVSIMALASTLDPDHNLFNGDSEYSEQETFECVLPSGESVPIIGSEDELNSLRGYLNRGVLISGVTTIEGLTLHSNDASYTDEINETNHQVVLPQGQWVFSNPPQTISNTNHINKYEGLKTLLVVKVTDRNGLSIPDSPSVISDKIFGTSGDRYTMSSQFAACSYGKLKMTNQYQFNVPTSAPGVIEVRIQGDITKVEIQTLRNEMRRAAEAKIGRSLGDNFDHALFLVEKCYVKCGWAGFAAVNGRWSVYHSHHYKSMAVTLHEIGHNLNLAHSGGNDGKEYTDHSCLMGNPWFKDDRGQMCFNPAKTFQLAASGAWYDTKYTLTWESGTKDPKYWIGRLIGIADYTNNPLNMPLVVKLETGEDTDYFVGFNRAYGINVDSKDANDKVTIIKAGSNGVGYSKSLMVTELGNGQSHTFNNWRGSGKTLAVKVRNIVKTSTPWFAEVELNFNNAPVPTASPSKKPTLRPVTTSPSKKPVPMPVSASPTRKVTISPTFTLTAIPTFTPTYVGESGSPVTLSPTRECGDGVCMPYESNIDCPEDCTNLEFQTYDDNIGAKGANGTMFSIQAARDVAITTISAFFRSQDEGLVQVYTKPGTYVGFEKLETTWTKIYDKTVTQNGKDVLTHLGSFINNAKVLVAKGEVQSFYVFSPNNLAYRKEEEFLEGDFVMGDESLNFFAGIAIAYGKFDQGQRFSPREFSGILRYDGIASQTPKPTTSPIEPTVSPAKPTTSPAAPTMSPSKSPIPTQKPASAKICFILNSKDQCIENASCQWLELLGVCRKNRGTAGKATKRRKVETN